jgi:hypothetical protein
VPENAFNPLNFCVVFLSSYSSLNRRGVRLKTDHDWYLLRFYWFFCLVFSLLVMVLLTGESALGGSLSKREDFFYFIDFYWQFFAELCVWEFWGMEHLLVGWQLVGLCRDFHYVDFLYCCVKFFYFWSN